MIVYRFRVSDRVYVERVDAPDGPFVPPHHTTEAPPEKKGFHAVMGPQGWYLESGPVPEEQVLPPPPLPYEEQWGRVRIERNARLASCDWTQLPDAPVDAAAWAVHRQALRDITKQPDPFTIVWPQEPEV